MTKSEKKLQEVGDTRYSDTYHFGKAKGDLINTVQTDDTRNDTMREYINRQLNIHTNTLAQQNHDITDLSDSVRDLSNRLQYYDTQISTMLNHLDTSVTPAYARSEAYYTTHISLDNKIEIRYKDRVYVTDPETLINLLFNLDEIVRAIVREELYNG